MNRFRRKPRHLLMYSVLATRAEQWLFVLMALRANGTSCGQQRPLQTRYKDILEDRSYLNKVSQKSCVLLLVASTYCRCSFVAKLSYLGGGFLI